MRIHIAEFVEIVLTIGIYDCVDWICLNKGILWILTSSTNKVSSCRTRDFIGGKKGLH